MKFAHLSDLHVKNSEDEKENKQLEKLRRHFADRHNGEDKPAILITGDLTDNGQADEYDRVAGFLRSLKSDGFEPIVCPGNHDYGKGGIHYRDESCALFFDKIEKGVLGYTGSAGDMASLYPKVSPFHEDKVVFFGIDSLAGKMDNIGNFHFLADGEVGKRQRERLRNQLVRGEYCEYTKIVYLHNHPWEIVPGHGLDDRSEFLTEIFGLADLICFGHLHVSNFWESREGMMAMNAGKSTDPVAHRGSESLAYREVAIHDGETSVRVVRVPVD